MTPQTAEHLGLGRRSRLEQYIREYRNGRDLTSRPRGVMVIDLFGLTAEDVQRLYPEVYQHITTVIKPQRDGQFAATRTKDAEGYAREWWLFEKPRQELRPALDRLPRYIATVETTKHRVFQFLDASILPDNMLIAIASDDSFILGILSARIHVVWAPRAGGWLGMATTRAIRNPAVSTRSPFPQPMTFRNNLSASSPKRLTSIASAFWQNTRTSP